MKRLLQFFVILLAIVVTMAGCGNSKDTPRLGGEEKTTSVVAAVAATDNNDTPAIAAEGDVDVAATSPPLEDLGAYMKHWGWRDITPTGLSEWDWRVEFARGGIVLQIHPEYANLIPASGEPAVFEYQDPGAAREEGLTLVLVLFPNGRSWEMSPKVAEFIRDAAKKY